MIIVTGTIAYDYIMNFPGEFRDHVLPSQLHQINLSFIVDKFAKRRGGTAGNVSYTLGLLKTPHILFSVVGSDFDEYRKKFKELGIDLSNVLVENKHHSSTGFAMTDKADNQIWGYFYGASDEIKNLKLSKVAKKGDLVLVGPSGAGGSMSFVNQCIELGIEYMFDPGFILTQVSDSDLKRGIENAKYIVGNDYEISLVKERVDLPSKRWDEKIIITTLGEKGAAVSYQGKSFEIKAAKPAKIIDPTGAGDAFRAGFLAGIEQGMDLQNCTKLACVAASFAIEEYGTQEHIFTKGQFLARYRQSFGDMLKF